ncbi:uncharacterized protein AB675_11475 [Cyphellophora attinorum]|uniref:AB hydrolase-1 domain-containing protein n=1 Tax=Cyphellophora attinorum TaxID=1664694 RepID=A0A0N1H3Y5_9EURO|nr:uncharacterized protein AB675_11475 [Phialophora attinorum]KPI39877.1 hypothetical protein AB675_11475 [Phialophora attinorum]
MLKDGPLNTLLIRLGILVLRLIAPSSIIYTLFRLSHLLNFASYDTYKNNNTFGPPYVLLPDIYLALEAAFYLLFALPRSYILNRAAPAPSPLKTAQERREVLERTWDATPEPRRYLEGYFCGLSVKVLRSEDVRDWLRWRLWGVFSKRKEAGHGDDGGDDGGGDVVVDEDEVNDYLSYTEEVLGHRFREGRSGRSFMAVTHEPVVFVHRPLLWYVLFIGSADTLACVMLWMYGFRFYRPSRWTFFKSFPLRPVVLLSSNSAPSETFTYWMLPHTSKDPKHQPVMFVHGVGVGLHFYLPFLRALLPHCRAHGIGIICLEVNQVCSRITNALPAPLQIVAEINQILEYHGWQHRRPVLLTHSYGSVIASHLLYDIGSREKFGPLIFADPVCFSFHPPDVAFNFLRRKPKSASEWQLWYFASMDPDVGRCMTRRFRWQESSLWRQGVEGRGKKYREAGRVTVLLSGKDIITDVETTGAYLTRSRGKDGGSDGKWYRQSMAERMDGKWKERKWTGKEGLEVVYLPGLNHAEIFEEERERALLVEIVKTYSLPA